MRTNHKINLGYSIQGYGREIPWGCARNIFQESQRLKLSFQGGQGKFSRGIIPVRVRISLLVGSYLENCFPMGRFWHHPSNSSPKVNLENCLPYPCMGKKWNSPLADLHMICSQNKNFYSTVTWVLEHQILKVIAIRKNRKTLSQVCSQMQFNKIKTMIFILSILSGEN